MSLVVFTGLAILALTLFLDTLELSFARITELLKAQLVERLQKLAPKRLEDSCNAALLAAKQSPAVIQARMEKAHAMAGANEAYLRTTLIDILLNTNMQFVQQKIAIWEKEGDESENNKTPD